MSLGERPRRLKRSTSALTSELGPGMFLLAADLLAVKLSLLPSSTSHVGPPDWSRRPEE